MKMEISDIDNMVKKFRRYRLFIEAPRIICYLEESFIKNLRCGCKNWDEDYDDYYDNFAICNKCYPGIRYDNNFGIKHKTMIKKFSCITDLDLKYSLVDVTDFHKFMEKDTERSDKK